MNKLHRIAVLVSWIPMIAALGFVIRLAWYNVGVHAPAVDQFHALQGSAYFVIIALGPGIGGTAVVWALTAGKWAVDQS